MTQPTALPLTGHGVPASTPNDPLLAAYGENAGGWADVLADQGAVR